MDEDKEIDYNAFKKAWLGGDEQPEVSPENLKKLKKEMDNSSYKGYSSSRYELLPDEEKAQADEALRRFVEVTKLTPYQLKQMYGTAKPLLTEDDLMDYLNTEWENNKENYIHHLGQGKQKLRERFKTPFENKTLMPLDEFFDKSDIRHSEVYKAGGVVKPLVKKSPDQLVIKWNNFTTTVSYEDKEDTVVPEWTITRLPDSYSISYRDGRGTDFEFQVEDEKELYDQFSLRYGLPIITGASWKDMGRKSKPNKPLRAAHIENWKRPSIEIKNDPRDEGLPF